VFVDEVTCVARVSIHKNNKNNNQLTNQKTGKEKRGQSAEQD
jgi:hypothetical protein